MYYTYALLSNDKKRIYVGLTKNLQRRINEHNKGRTKSTRYYRSWTLLYFERTNTLKDARLKEKKLKSGYGKEFLKSFFKKSHAPIAQLDRAFAYEAKGQWFESTWARFRL